MCHYKNKPGHTNAIPDVQTWCRAKTCISTCAHKFIKKLSPNITKIVRAIIQVEIIYLLLQFLIDF